MHSVLLVDDEQFARQGLRNLIDWEQYGYQVVNESDNGEDALSMIEQLQPDLVVTDIRMPVLDGLELIRRSVNQNHKQPSFIIISGYNEFQYAQQAVRFGVHDFLLKPIDEDELIVTLQKLDQRLKQTKWLFQQQRLIASEMDALIKGEATDEITDKWMKELQLTKNSDLYYAFIEMNNIHPWREQPIPRKSRDEKKQIHQVVLNVLKRRQSIYIHEHRNRYGLMITDRDLRAYGDDIARFTRTLQKQLTVHFGVPIYVYVGKPVKKLTELIESYRSARDALQYKFVKNDDQIVIHDDVQSISLNHVLLEELIGKQLLEYIEEQNVSAINSAVDRLFMQFASEAIAPEAIKTSIHHFVLKTISTIREMDGSEQDLTTLEPIMSWHDLHLTLDELKRLFTEFVMECADLINDQRKDKMKGSILKVKQYIDEHFTQSLTLKSIASQFYLNPVYLGQLFKKTYGMYFNDYVLHLRIQEAKKLLRQTDLRIYEIAEKVGFNNTEYFVTQFEKLESSTPSVYRMQLIEQSEEEDE